MLKKLMLALLVACVIAGATTSVLVAALPATSAAQYRFTELVDLEPWGMNSKGQVSGRVISTQRPFLWSPTSPNATTGSSIVIPVAGSTGGAAESINAYGQVAGTSVRANDTGAAFLWTPTTPNGTTGNAVDLIPALNVSGHGINSRGQVVISDNTVSLGGAFLWSPTTPNTAVGGYVDLGVWKPTVINDYGQLAGALYVLFDGSLNPSAQHAALWTPTRQTPTPAPYKTSVA